MSLPFLNQPKRVADSIMSHRKKDGSVESSEHPPEVLAAAEEAINHIHAKNPHGFATAIKNLTSLFDSAPHGNQDEED